METVTERAFSEPEEPESSLEPVAIQHRLRTTGRIGSWTGAVLAKIMVLVFIVIFIQKRPQGMFAMKGRSAEA